MHQRLLLLLPNAPWRQYLKYDHEKEWKRWEKGVAHIEDKVKPLKGVTTRVTVPPLGNITPTLAISWDNTVVKMSAKDLQEKLRHGTPSIEVGGVHDNTISITVWVMKPGEEKIVARRLVEELTKASV